MWHMQKSDGIVIQVQDLSILSCEDKSKTRESASHQNEGNAATTTHDGPTR